MKTKKDLLQLIEANKGLSVEFYCGDAYGEDIDNIEQLHSDNCRYVEVDLKTLQSSDILDFGIVSPNDYLNTILANSCITADDIDNEPVLVVAVSSNINFK